MAIQMTAASAEVSTAARELLVRVRKRLRSFVLDVEFVAAPAITVLFGASGAGKTTLLDCIAGLTTPDDGAIRLQPVGSSAPASADVPLFGSAAKLDVPVPKRGVGYVFQDLALFPNLSAGENIGYGLADLAKSERDRRVRDIAQSFRIAELLDRRPAQISGGEQQRVALARALVLRPRLLLLDEPLAGLDAPTRARLIQDLRAWHAAHPVPTLLVTHTREEVFALAESVLVIESGRIVARGTPQQALEAPQRESVAQLAGYENIFAADVAALHPESGTMTCRIAGSDAALEVPFTRLLDARGEKRHAESPTYPSVRLGIRAGDILLATAAPQQISARNILRGSLESLAQIDVTVVAIVDCGGSRFEVHLTPGARDSLALAPGREVWLVVKTHSCRVLQ